MKIERWIGRGSLVISLGVLAVAGFAACGDDDDSGDDVTPAATSGATIAGTAASGDGDEAEVEAVVQAAYDAWNAKDVNALLAVFTEQGALAVLGDDEEGATYEQIQQGLPEFIGESPITTQGFENTEIDGSEATTDSNEMFGPLLDNTQYVLVEEAGTWKIDGQNDLEDELPEGVTAVHVDMDEFAFGVNAADISNANGPDGLALETSNVGEQPHEMALALIPADAVIDELLMTEEDVPGFEFLGGIGPFEPGEGGNMILVEALEPGRYVLTCFLPDTAEGPEGTPHALKGMYTEFVIE